MAFVRVGFHRTPVEPHQADAGARHLEERREPVFCLRAVVMRTRRRGPREPAVPRPGQSHVVGIRAVCTFVGPETSSYGIGWFIGISVWPSIGCDIRIFHMRPIDPAGGRSRKKTWNETG